jgi:glycosyltransferase involved in cell wall biosynthesis
MSAERQSLSIVHAIARLNVGGAALHVIELAARQQARGHRVAIVAGTLSPGEESMEYLAHDLGVQIIDLPALQRELSPRADFVAMRELRRSVHRRRADVLHTHTAKAGATGRIGAALPGGGGVPRATIHTFHGHVLAGYFPPHRERVFIQAERILARHTSAIVAVSVEVRDDLVRLGVAPAKRIAVIPYGFDLSGFRPAKPTERAKRRTALHVPADAFVIGWVGRLAAIKRPHDLVRVVAALADRGVDGYLVAVGDGEERASVERLAAELGVTGRCRLVGYRRDVREWYGVFDAFVLTSENEGTPVVAIEALAAGCPVVATRAGGTATVVRDGETGFLAPVGDVGVLASRLLELATDPHAAAAMGKAGGADVRRRFSADAMEDSVETLYRSILERR